MGSTFILKNQQCERLRRLKDRFPDVDVSALEAYRALLEVATALQAAADERMARLGASQGRACLLMQLDGCEQDALMPSALAQRMGVTRATVTGLIDGLEKDGLVRRERGEEDRRAVAVKLTAKGRASLSRILTEHYRSVTVLMTPLTEADRRELLGLLRKLASALESCGRL